jgi:hypothetical protein
MILDIEQGRLESLRFFCTASRRREHARKSTTPVADPPASCGRGGAAEQAEIFPGHGGARERGDLGRIIGRRDLDDVEADEGQPREAAQDRLRLPAREPKEAS